MKRFLVLLISILTLSGCFHDPVWMGKLFIKNDSESVIHVDTNIRSCNTGSPYTDPGYSFDIQPGKAIRIGQSDTFPDESSVTIENIISNCNDDAYVTVTSNVDGLPHSRTWTYTERNGSGKQLFRLKDCTFEDWTDNHYPYTENSYFFKITEEDFY